MKKRLLSLLLALCLLVTVLPTAVLAEGTEDNQNGRTVEIDSSEKLVAAIKDQQDGDTWVFTKADTYDAATPASEGNNGGYDLPAGVEMPYPDGQMANHVGPYVFPIYAENLTIKKADDVTGEVVLTSSAVATYNNNDVPGVNGGGNWNWQSFMIISASGVTIEGVTLKGNRNEYGVNGNAGGWMGKQCDKIIETVDGAGDLTLRNVTIAPQEVIDETGAYEKYNGTQRSGSIYFSHAYDAEKTVTLENVYTYGGIKSVNNVNIALNGVTVDATNNTYADYNAGTASYAWNPGIRGNGTAESLSNARVGENGFKIIVDDSIDSRQIFNPSLLDGTTVQFKPGNYDLMPNSAYSVAGQTGWYLPIEADNITLQGIDANGQVITDATKTQANLYSTDYAANGSWPSQDMIAVWGNHVVIEGLTIMNKVDANKAIEVIGGETAMNFTVRNCKFAPIAMDLIPEDGVKNEAGEVVYDETYAQYGASLYFMERGKYTINATVENNWFYYSSVSLGATTKGTYNITGNTFEGAKNWNQDPDYYYSTIGYQGKWLHPDPDCATLGTADVNVTNNTFKDAGAISFSQIVEGSTVADFTNNIGFDLTKISGPVKVDGKIYADSEAALKVAIAAADADDVVVLTKDVSLSSTLTIDKTVTIDGQNFTITGDVDGRANGFDVTNGTFTIQNVILKDFGGDAATTQDIGVINVSNNASDPTVNVINVTFQNFNRAALNINAGKFTVTNCNIDCSNNSPVDHKLTKGIFVGYDATGTVKGTTITNSVSAYAEWTAAGIEVLDSANVTIEDTTISNAPVGVYAYVYGGEYGDGATVTLRGNNNIAGSDYAVAAGFGEEDAAVTVNIEGGKYTGNLYVGDDDGEDDTNLTSDYAKMTITGGKFDSDVSEYLAPGYVVDGEGNVVAVSSGPATYSVTVSSAANGKVTTSTARASKGSTVTLTVTPDKGYALDQLTVTDANGNAVSVTKVSDTKYTFTMPASFVTVRATFVEKGLPFTDVAVSDWFYEAVKYVYDNGMMNGTTATKFGPDAQLTRGMIVTILYRLENEPTVSGNTFADVNPSQYYADPIAWAAKSGIVTGYDETTFGPENSITREQLAAILYRYATYKGYDVSKAADLSAYTDADSVSSYAEDAMAWANAEGLITGVTSTTLNPTGTATRAQVAAILARFMANVG